MYGGGDNLEERGSCDLDVPFVLVDIFTGSFSCVHLIIMTRGHVFHDLDQRLN